MTGLAAVQARVAELQSLVAPRAATSVVAPSSTATASSAAFSDALARANDLLGTTPTGTTDAVPPSGGGIAPGSGVTGQDLVAAAEKYVGTPYVWGGESLSEGGLDCSGLVLRSLTDLGIGDGIPRVARDQQDLGDKVDSLDDALPGDLLVFGGGTHIAIYVGDGKMIDAPKPGGHVSVRDVYAEPTNIRRILPQEQQVVATSVPSAFGSSALAGLGSSLDLSSLLGSSSLGSPQLGSSLLGSSLLGTSAQGSSASDASRLQWEVLAGLMGGAA